MSDADVSFDEAGSAVLAALAVIVVRFDTAEQATIADEADAVHQARILVRRMRSILAVFGPLFDDARVRRLRSGLAELGDELGGARDVEVRVAHAERHLDESVPREVRARLVDAERERYRRIHDELVAFLRDAGHERRQRLADFIVDPPVLGTRDRSRAGRTRATARAAVPTRAEGRKCRDGRPRVVAPVAPRGPSAPLCM